jgi:hypothetical protein
MISEGSGSGTGSGSISLTGGSGSGSGRPKNMWIRWIRIRIRIHNTVQNAKLVEINVYLFFEKLTLGKGWAVIQHTCCYDFNVGITSLPYVLG